ncbi:MFS transporter [Paenibacillus ginsengarvi]|uniref:MFS transporter n=1 Tax=Paenibacillus ginsengarvi TaxID=400777 RepID=A0A3B0C8S1_9BACL|nr:MFS transporter [Paenibacillus ginsengarvi]RKN80734.1 MFS transporter [Paenibacillus ginsengarvi]
MKTAIWLYLFMFVAFFDLHAQYPILTPFAISLGAAPTFIGWMMGMYSLTHLPGNLLAGHWVDRYGSKPFICLSMLLAGVLLLYQSKVTDPWQLLTIRSISGFVLAFLSPACLAMLAKLGTNSVQQGKLMAGNGFVHTLASVISPAAGALLVAKIGFTTTFSLLGWALIVIGASAFFFIHDTKAVSGSTALVVAGHGHGTRPAPNRHGVSDTGGIPWLFYGVPLGLACSQGILFFELPLMKSSQQSLLTSGLLFSMVSLGALCTLSLLFLHKYSPLGRTVVGGFTLALAFFGLSVHWPLPLLFTLLLIGMAKGVIFPAMATLLASVSSASRYGRVFSFLAISSSLGAFIGPVLAGQLRHSLSPYFIAFFIMMLALTLLVPGKFRTNPDAPPVAE